MKSRAAWVLQAATVLIGLGARDAAARAGIEADGGQIVFCRERGGRVDLQDLVAKLADRGLMTVMVEGGPRLAAGFLEDGLVDRWLRYEAPRVLGAGVGWPDGGRSADGRGAFHVTGTAALGADLLTVLDRTDFAATLARVTL